MNEITLLDCTLRDGGYINDWLFGQSLITNFGNDITKTNVDIFEVSFLRNEDLKPERCIYPGTTQMFQFFSKKPGTLYAGMIESGCLIPQELIPKHSDSTLDIIRFVTWKEKLQLAYDYCLELINKGYKVCIQPTRVDQYSLDEFEEMCQKMKALNPMAIYIVDTLGSLDSHTLLEYVKCADSVLPSEIAIGYHAHNNMMQAVGNSEVFLAFPMNREKLIDASVMGVGRGAGNLPLEVIIKILNERYEKNYSIDAVLELASKYIQPLKEKHSWGYNPWYYITAQNKINPNYALYFSEKNKISISDFQIAVSKLSDWEKVRYTEETAQKLYNDLKQYT